MFASEDQFNPTRMMYPGSTNPGSSSGPYPMLLVAQVEGEFFLRAVLQVHLHRLGVEVAVDLVGVHLHRGALLRHLDAGRPQDRVDDQAAEVLVGPVPVRVSAGEAERPPAVLALERPGDDLLPPLVLLR